MRISHASAIVDGMTVRCLVVDDSAHFLRAARALLEREGLVVDVASTGAEALQRAKSLRPHVVLVDIDLGQERGFDVARQLDEGLCEPSVIIILISTHAEDEFEDLIVTSPAIGFLAKSSLSARAIYGMVSDGGERTFDSP
jgi:CheY-like chemotaxis protein